MINNSSFYVNVVLRIGRPFFVRVDNKIHYLQPGDSFGVIRYKPIKVSYCLAPPLYTPLTLGLSEDELIVRELDSNTIIVSTDGHFDVTIAADNRYVVAFMRTNITPESTTPRYLSESAHDPWQEFKKCMDDIRGSPPMHTHFTSALHYACADMWRTHVVSPYTGSLIANPDPDEHYPVASPSPEALYRAKEVLGEE